MNGRVYDPRLGRFLQADPYVQAPKNSQNLNRYSYVLNNPLSYTDPSGYFFSSLLKNFGRFLSKYYRVIFAAVISYATFGAASGWAAATAWGGTAGGATTSLGTAFAGAAAGAAGGFVLTGTLEGAIWGAVSGAALGAIGASQLRDPQKVLAAGASGGILSELQGGKFGHGFVSAGVGFWSGMTFGGELSVGNFFASVAVAGTVSELTGGKFANGAVSAAISFAMGMEQSGRGFGGASSGSGANDDQIALSDSMAVGELSFDYTIRGPKGFAAQVRGLLVDIASTDAGSALLAEISKNGGTVRFNYQAGRDPMARGSLFNRRTTISFDPNRVSEITTSIGRRPAQLRFVVAHELHHAWKNTLNCWLGCNRSLIPPGAVPRGINPWEVHAVRYTNMVRAESGVGYRRTSYSGVSIP